MMPAGSRVASGLLTAAFLLFMHAVSEAAPPIQTHAITHLLDITGGAAGRLALPTDVAVYRGRIYVVDGGNHRVVAFDSQGKHLFSIGGEGSAEGQFRNPVGLGVDGNGRLYVADRGNQRIQIFDNSGKLLRAFKVQSGGRTVRPIDVAPSPKGDALYVTGNDNHKLMVFAPDGKLLREWGGNGAERGEFRYPATIALMPDARLAVVDVLNTRVQVFDQKGTFLVSVGEWGVLPGQLFRPKGVAVDAQGRFYVSDSYLDLVQVYDDGGRFLHVLGQDGEPHRMTAPAGVAIDDNNRLYVAEMLEHKISVFDLGK